MTGNESLQDVSYQFLPLIILFLVMGGKKWAKPADLRAYLWLCAYCWWWGPYMVPGIKSALAVCKIRTLNNSYTFSDSCLFIDSSHCLTRLVYMTNRKGQKGEYVTPKIRWLDFGVHFGLSFWSLVWKAASFSIGRICKKGGICSSKWGMRPTNSHVSEHESESSNPHWNNRQTAANWLHNLWVQDKWK